MVGGVCCGWQVGPAEENELILTAVLDALHETLLILLRGQVKKHPRFYNVCMCVCMNTFIRVFY